MAEIVYFPRRSDWEPELSKKQLAAHYGFTTRWVELRLRGGDALAPRLKPPTLPPLRGRGVAQPKEQK